MNDIYGLVLIGGQSRRMGTNKAVMHFHGVPQYVYCYQLLGQFCDRVFLSLKKDQQAKYDSESYSCIYDAPAYNNKGPLGGILSAMDAYPEQAWLVLACDLPNVDEQVLRPLIAHRNGEKAVVYKSVTDGLPEPLCALYEKTMRPVFQQKMDEGVTCPRKILIQEHIDLLELKSFHGLDNMNTEEDIKRREEYGG